MHSLKRKKSKFVFPFSSKQFFGGNNFLVEDLTATMGRIFIIDDHDDDDEENLKNMNFFQLFSLSRWRWRKTHSERSEYFTKIS